MLDGNARARNGTAKVLARLGVNTSSAALGMHVEMWLNTAMHEGEPFDWALIDANMGTDESLAIARDIATRSPDTRIVFMLTVAGKGSNPTPFREASYTHFVRKPLLEHDLARVLSNVNTEAVASKPEGAPAAASEPEHSGSSILVAEDLTDARDSLQQLLHLSLNLDVDVAADGLIALEMLRKKPYSVLITDLRMPKKSGLELIQAILDEKLPVTCIVTTGPSIPSSSCTSEYRPGTISPVGVLCELVRDVVKPNAPASNP